MPGKNKMYIFAGSHMVAAGEGKIDFDGKIGSAPSPEAWGREDADPMQDMLDAADKMNARLNTEWPELTFSVKMNKKKLRKAMRTFNVKKTRLPRKLKKAARHADFTVFDLQTKNAAHPTSHMVSFTIEYDLRVCITPAGYPRTRSIIRLAKLVRRELNKNYQKFIQNKFKTDRTI